MPSSSDEPEVHVIPTPSESVVVEVVDNSDNFSIPDVTGEAPVPITEPTELTASTNVQVVDVEAQAVSGPSVGSNAFVYGTTAATRAEFLSASVVKETADTRLGVQLSQDDNGEIRISKLPEDGILKDSPLRVGDRVVSINSKSCHDIDRDTAIGMLQQTVGYATIVVHNAGGAANLVETMVMKPTEDAKVGIFLRTNARGSLEVASVSSEGLFARSLLNGGDRVLSINGVPCERLEPETAIGLIRSAKSVVFLTETQHSTGLVLSACSVPHGGPLELAATDSRRMYEDDARRIQQHMCVCMWMIILAIGAITLVVGLVLR